MSAGVALWLGPAILGLIVAAVGWFMIQKARTKLKGQPLVPRKTIESLQEDKQWMQHKLQRA